MKETIIKQKVLDCEHIHIDNGGYTFQICQYGDDDNWYLPVLEIGEGFFGYAESKITFNENVTPETLETIGKFFFRAANRLKETGIF